MNSGTASENKRVKALRKMAMGYPGAVEGTSCNKIAFKARDKSFLFVGSDDESYSVMLKLRDSLPEAQALAAKEPEHCKAGSTGWVTLTFGLDENAPDGMLKRWVDESYRLLAPKSLLKGK